MQTVVLIFQVLLTHTMNSIQIGIFNLVEAKSSQCKGCWENWAELGVAECFSVFVSALC